MFAVATVLLTKYYLSELIEKNVISMTCSMYRDRRSVNMMLVGRPEGLRPLGKLRHRWEDNI